jgi:hypothetical protein
MKTPEVALALQTLRVERDTLDFAELVTGVSTDSGCCGPDSGERALMRAILQDGVLCLQQSASDVLPRERERVAWQARRWIASRDVSWIFSFESICHVLNIDPDGLRRRLLNPPANAGARTASACSLQPKPTRRYVSHKLHLVRLRGNQTTRPLRGK